MTAVGSKIDAASLLELTTNVVSAYVGNNSVRMSDLPALVVDIANALDKLGQPSTPEPEPLKPAVPIRKSVTDEHIISLEDGKPYKTLRRHLAIRGLTPDEYRAKWGLPKDYPMVAPAYAARRSELAKALGLGRKAKPQPEPQPKRRRSAPKATKAKAKA